MEVLPLSVSVASIPVQRLAYKVEEVAQLLGLSVDKVYELVRASRIPHKRLGRRIIVPREPFETWLNSSEVWTSSDCGADRG